MANRSGSNRRAGAPARGARVLLLALAPLLLAACDSAEERVQSHYERGLALVEEGRPGKAILEFTNAIRIDEGFVPAHAELARLQRAEGNLRRAGGHLEIVLDARPEDVESRILFARTLLDLGAPVRALEEAEAALERAPEAPGALGVAAAAELMVGDLDRAVARAKAALAADPEETLARLALVAERVRAEDPEGALAMLEAAPESVSEDDAVGLGLIRVRLLAALDDRAGVGEELKRLVELRPETTALRLALARWHAQGDPPDLDAAEAELRAAAAIDPADEAAALRVAEFLGATQGREAYRAELERLVAEGGEAAPAFERALATAEFRAGDRGAAMARMETAIAREDAPEAADAARLMLARFLGAPEDAERRAELIDEVIARDPSNDEALAMRAELALRDGRPEDAVTDLNAALEETPDSAPLLELLAVAHERTGDLALAAERRALAVRASGAAPGPSLRHAGALAAEGKLETAESVLLDSLQENPREARLWRALSELRLRRRDWAGAEQALDRLETVSEEAAADADRLRAAALFGAGEVDETLQLLEEGWRGRGERRDLEALVRGYIAAERLEEAETLLEEKLAERPGDLQATILMAEVAAADGRPDEAEAILRDAVADAPGNGRLHAVLVRFLSARGEREAAREALRAGFEAAPDTPELRFGMAVQAELAEDFEAAIGHYERLLEIDPNNTLVINNLAALISDHRDDAESLERAARLARRLRQSPSPAFRETYGWLLHLTGESSQAVAVLRGAVPELPDNAIAQYHLGVAYAAIGEGGLAREQLRRALELHDAGAFLPQRDAARETLARLEAEAAEAAAAEDGNG